MFLEARHEALRLARRKTRLAFVLVFVSTGLLYTSFAQDKVNRSLDIEPQEIVFGPHDVGTATSRTVLVKNLTDAAVRLTAITSGNDQSEFSWKSTCLGNVPPHSDCDVSVVFAPVVIIPAEERNAELVISDGTLAIMRVSLKGSALQNLAIAPQSLEFGERTVNTSSGPLAIVATNYSTATITSLNVTVSADFSENHSKCEKIAPGASCTVSVSYAPKLLGVNRGTLTITADQTGLGKLPRVVLLQGTGASQCVQQPFSYRTTRALLVALIGGLYFLGLVLVRWHMIAKPARAQLIAAVNAVRARLIAETAGLNRTADLEGRIERIHFLLDWALYSFRNKYYPVDARDAGREQLLAPPNPPWHTRLFNAVFWPRGQELAGWSCAHEAEFELVELLPLERVRAGMEMAEPQLRALNTPTSLALAARLHETLGATNSNLERERALLAEGLGLIYERSDTDYFQLASWHAKMMWLVGCALLFILALAATLQNAVLLLMGAVGGLLSRLARTVAAADVANDYGASWGALFLSPLSGALSAWGGILLIVLGLRFNIFGSALNIDWCNPYDPAILAIALLFGFSERFFDGIASQLESKFVKTPPETAPAPTPSPAKPAPRITSVEPPSLGRGAEISLTVIGNNFMQGASAALTNEDGSAVSATVESLDSTKIVVKATLSGQHSYESTLTITNPDKQVATLKVPVS